MFFVCKKNNYKLALAAAVIQLKKTMFLLNLINISKTISCKIHES